MIINALFLFSQPCASTSTCYDFCDLLNHFLGRHQKVDGQMYIVIEVAARDSSAGLETLLYFLE